MRQAVRQKPQFFHQAGDPVQHGVDLAGKLIEGVPGARKGHPLRQVAHTARRLSEAARLGFTRAIVPVSAPEPPPGIAVIRAGTLADAVAAARGTGD